MTATLQRRIKASDSLSLAERQWICRYANKVHSIAMRRQGLTIDPLPVPIEEWIELVFGLEIGYVSGDSTALGQTDARSGAIDIFEDVQANEGQRHFTAGHELFHALIHRKKSGTSWLKDRFKGEREEKAAELFSATFLMPDCSVKRVIAVHAQAILKGDLFRLADIERYSAWSLWFWKELTQRSARTFGVSLTACMIRMTNVRLKDGSRFMPQAFVPAIIASWSNKQSMSFNRAFGHYNPMPRNRNAD